MLCVYSVSTTVFGQEQRCAKVFDASDTTWHLHLPGAKLIAQALSHHEHGLAILEFLQPWIDYHETFAGYSYLPREVPQHEQDVILPEGTPATRNVTNAFRELLQK
jgi:hypothetical protein